MNKKNNIPKNLDIEELVEKEERRMNFLERIRNFERKNEEIRRAAQIKTDKRDERINAELAEQKRKQNYLSAVEKILGNDEER